MYILSKHIKHGSWLFSTFRLERTPFSQKSRPKNATLQMLMSRLLDSQLLSLCSPLFEAMGKFGRGLVKLVCRKKIGQRRKIEEHLKKNGYKKALPYILRSRDLFEW